MITPSDVVDLYTERRKLWDTRHRQMAAVAEVYDHEADVPLPELDRNEKPSVANLVRQGVDQEAMRVASPHPQLHVPALRKGESAADRADERRRAWLGMWEANNMPVVQRLRARHLLGMGAGPVVLWADETMQGARWEVIDPRMAFPPPHRRPGQVVPDDFMFARVRTLAWCRKTYPEVARKLSDDRAKPDDAVRLICHIDADRITLVACRDTYAVNTYKPLTRSEPVGYVDNRAQMPLATYPAALTMSKDASQFEGMLGMYHQRAMLMALQVQAVKRGVFRDWWLEEQDQANPAEIIRTPDPYTGQPGIVRGRLVPDQVDPQFATTQLLQDIEYAERMTGSIPPDFGGQSSTNVRTGRRASQLLSSTIDFHIEEAQLLLANSLQAECEMAAEIEKGWFGDVDKSFYVNGRGVRGYVGYRPRVLWGESTECRVTYAMAGADTDALIIGAGQRVGMETLSKRSFMEFDPLVEDPEFEADRVKGERIEAAFLASIEQQAASGQGPFADPVLLGRLQQMVTEDRAELFEAVATLNSELQAEQEAAAQAQMEGAPAEMPGLAGPPATIAPAAEAIPGVANLAGVLAPLRMGQMRSAVEA